ncbi:MAG: hypothetical protein V3T74_13575 [Gemmatimonadales bacterium]|jgi:hypothetical protein
MIWPLALVILLLALLIPILVFAFDVPRLRERARDADRMLPERERQMDELIKRVLTLEDEVDDVSRNFESMRDEMQFLQRLIENPEQRDPPDRLAPPKT